MLHRNGQGMKCYNINEKTGELVAIKAVVDDMESMLITNSGIVIRTRVNEIATTGRVASGVKLMNLSKDEDAKVVGVVRVWETDDDDEDGAPDSEIEDESESTKEETEE